MLCNLNDRNPGDPIGAPNTPPASWFTDAPAWMTAGYANPVALCGEETGRVAFRVAEFAEPFKSPYFLPNGEVVEYHPRGVEMYSNAWDNPLVVAAADGSLNQIGVGLLGAEHSTDLEPESFEHLATHLMAYHVDVRSLSIGDVVANPFAGLAYVTWHEDEVGPYVLGALAPGVDVSTASRMFTSQISTELAYDGSKFFAFPPALVGRGNASRSGSLQAAASSGSANYAVRILAVADGSCCSSCESAVNKNNDDGASAVKSKEDDTMSEVDLKPILDQIGALSEGFGEAINRLDEKIEARTPDPEPEPEAWEAPLQALTDQVTEGLKDIGDKVTERLDAIDAAVTANKEQLEAVNQSAFDAELSDFLGETVKTEGAEGTEGGAEGAEGSEGAEGAEGGSEGAEGSESAEGGAE